MSKITWETATREQIIDLAKASLSQHYNPLTGIFNQREVLNWYRAECERLTVHSKKLMDELYEHYIRVDEQEIKIKTLNGLNKVYRDALKRLKVKKKLTAKKKTPNSKKVKK